VRFYLSFFVVLACVLSACSASTAPVVKIGLAAPFEGRYRAIGYEAIYAARLAIREINAAGGIGGYRVELFALDDGGDPAMAIEQARKMAIDPQVIAVIGHYRPETTGAATGHYCAERLPLLAVEPVRTGVCHEVLALTPPITTTLPSSDPASFLFAGTVPHPADVPKAAGFVEAYNAIPIDGTRAGPIALQTYDAMYLLFDALRRNIQTKGKPSRDGMARALAESDFTGLGGVYRFDSEGNQTQMKMYMYRYSKDGEPELISTTDDFTFSSWPLPSATSFPAAAVSPAYGVR
jgi:ABC-type branched-subunit amino acid transport system substrate-binding protein